MSMKIPNIGQGYCRPVARQLHWESKPGQKRIGIKVMGVLIPGPTKHQHAHVMMKNTNVHAECMNNFHMKSIKGAMHDKQTN
jgi:hypothetical protein